LEVSGTLDFIQNIYLGFKRQAWPKSLLIPQKIIILSNEIETTGNYAGSSHVLEMGRHYEDYARYDWEVPPFLKVSGFPTSASMLQLEMKARCPGVTGNIGETLAGIVAFQTLKCDSADIAHLVVQSKQKTPDFLVRMSPDLQPLLIKLSPSLSTLSLPSWWPLESKIRSGAMTPGVINQGLQQLAALWYRMKEDQPDGVGFGIVVGVGLKKPRQIRIHFFLPENKTKHEGLLKHFNSLPKMPKFTRSELGTLVSYLI
jgi:hypothetical protein